MRFLDANTKADIRNLQLYLTVKEAKEMVQSLEALLADAEAPEHFYVISQDGGWELSCSLITIKKLSVAKYTKREMEILKGHKFN